MSLLNGTVYLLTQFHGEGFVFAEVLGDLSWLDEVKTAIRSDPSPRAADLIEGSLKVVVQEREIASDVMEYQGLIAVSPRAKQLIQGLSANCRFVPVEVNGQEWSWLIPCVFEANCIDEHKTVWRTLRNGNRYPDEPVFDGLLTSGEPIFRVPSYDGTVFCSREFVQALLASDLKGMCFEDHSCVRVMTDDGRGERRKEYYSKDVRAYRARQAARSSKKLPFPEVTGKVSADDLGSLLGTPLFYTRFLQTYPLALRRLRSSGPDPKVFVSDCELLKEPGAVVSLNRSLWEDPVTRWSEDLPENKWPREFIAIGGDLCGNYFLVKSGDESGAVWFYNHDGGTFTRRYAHIDDFVKELVEGRYKAPFGPF